MVLLVSRLSKLTMIGLLLKSLDAVAVPLVGVMVTLSTLSMFPVRMMVTARI